LTPEEPRFRVSAKQNAKNLWALDGTVEYKQEFIEISINPNDPGDTISNTLGLRLLSIIKETEKAFRDDGRQIVGDNNND